MPDAKRCGTWFGWRLVTLAVLSVSAIAAGTAAAATLSPAERAFVKVYEKLVPTLNRASSALVRAVDGAGKDSDPQLVTIFTGVAHQWATATKPLLALHAPVPEAKIFATASRYARSVEADLLAVVQSGRSSSVSAAKAAGTRLALDFNTLAAEIRQLKAKLGLG